MSRRNRACLSVLRLDSGEWFRTKPPMDQSAVGVLGGPPRGLRGYLPPPTRTVVSAFTPLTVWGFLVRCLFAVLGYCRCVCIWPASFRGDHTVVDNMFPDKEADTRGRKEGMLFTRKCGGEEKNRKCVGSHQILAGRCGLFAPLPVGVKAATLS